MSIAAISAASAGATIADRQLIADNLDTFLQLLTTQLKNQDPLEPIDTNEFTAQLVQFSQVEQAVKSNSLLEALATSQALSASQAAVGYIGKVVTADGATTLFTDGQAAWAIDAAETGTGNFTIRDQNGAVVYTHTAQIGKGQSAFVWDGTTSTGVPAHEGLYTLTVTARDTADRPVSVGTSITGVVSGAEFDGGEPLLDIAGIKVRLASVSAVSLP